ncbi:MAG: potassium-transporting ATPase subunit KdpA, partial [Caldilineaceae bacterium]|nr:potassium-transporting ATPase subunit KdpA [Caldilineaceae bacterium]
MTINGFLQISLFVAILILLAKPLGSYMARVYQGESTLLDPLLHPIERCLYRLCGVRFRGATASGEGRDVEEMNWQTYAIAMLLFSAVSFLFLYALQRVQAYLPLNPARLGAVAADSSFNTAISFVSNTNWQGYGGETTMSYLTQMMGLTVQNFVSAAAGMAILVALMRGIARHSAQTIGNFWVDLTRTILYILLPLSLLLAVVLVSQGVVQTFAPYQRVSLLQPTLDAEGNVVTEQLLALGPAASQIAIKQLGTNGGGFFNVNSAHPFENATPLSNLLEMLSILLIPAALCYTFGKLVEDTRQ